MKQSDALNEKRDRLSRFSCSHDVMKSENCKCLYAIIRRTTSFSSSFTAVMTGGLIQLCKRTCGLIVLADEVAEDARVMHHVVF